MIAWIDLDSPSLPREGLSCALCIAFFVRCEMKSVPTLSLSCSGYIPNKYKGGCFSRYFYIIGRYGDFAA